MKLTFIGVTSQKYVSNRTIKRKCAKGDIIEVGSLSDMPLEKIAFSKTKILLYSGGFGDFPTEKKLNSIGVTCIPMYDWKEKHPLGTAEWIKFLGYLTNKPKEAKKYFQEINAQYLTFRQYASGLKTNPSVMSGNMYGDVWNTPAGESYLATMLNDANVNYTYKDTKGTGSLQLTLEEVIKVNTSTTYWINPGFPTRNEITNVNPKSKYLKAFENSEIYCYSHNMNRWWELNAIEPHHVLNDFIKIFHSKEPLDSLFFYKKVEQ